jgi:Leucine-rich repeat (LRR) protein
LQENYDTALSWDNQKNQNKMSKLKILIIGLLLINILTNGQVSNSVVVFQGRKAAFKSQKILDLSYQNIKEVPIETSNSEIEILILDNNNIEKLPRWIGNLRNLKILSIRNNNLLELNSAVARCENLEQLYLSGNKNLSDIPSMSFCEKLEIIDVVDTKINEVPGWVQMMDCLIYFKYTIKK